MKKRLVIWIGAILLCTVGIVFLTGYLLSRTLDVSAENAALTVEPQEVPLGGAVTAQITLDLPLFVQPPEAVFQPPQGMVAAGTAQWHKNYGWNKNRWKLDQSFRALSLESGTGGSVSLNFAGQEPVLLQFPAVTIRSVPAEGAELDLAGALPPGKPVSAWYGWIAGAVLILAIAALWWWKMRSSAKMEVFLPPWIRAEQELGILQKELEDGKTGLETGFLRLTDLLRAYLEERFQMPARKRTAEEFLEELRSDSNPLPPSEKPFLRDFMSAAELVKFAKQPPERTLLLRALNGAKELVIHTTPAEENKEGKNV